MKNNKIQIARNKISTVALELKDETKDIIEGLREIYSLWNTAEF